MTLPLPLPSCVEHRKTLFKRPSFQTNNHFRSDIYSASIEDDSIFPWCCHQNHIWLDARVFDFFSCVLPFPLLILSSILHIVDIVIDVFAAVRYSNFKRTRSDERFSSIFIRQSEIFILFSCSSASLLIAWVFLFHALPCLIFSLRHLRYFKMAHKMPKERKVIWEREKNSAAHTTELQRRISLNWK